MQLTEWCIASGLGVSSDTLGEKSPSFSIFSSLSVLPGFVRRLNLPIEALFLSNSMPNPRKDSALLVSAEVP